MPDDIENPSDSGQQSTEGDNRAKPTSPRKVEANRRNAQRSTGPQTASGKRRSSQNAVKHGAYRQLNVLVLDGEMPDDEVEDADLFARTLDALAPANGLEAEIAIRIALGYLSLRRVDRYETALLEEAGVITPTVDQALGIGRGVDHCALNTVIEVLETAVDDGEPDLQDLSWEGLTNAAYIYLKLNPGGVAPPPSSSKKATTKGDPADELMNVFGRSPTEKRRRHYEAMWGNSHPPESDEQWRSSFFGLIDREFDNLDAAVSWYKTRQSRGYVERAEQGLKTTAYAARRSLRAMSDCADARDRRERQLTRDFRHLQHAKQLTRDANPRNEPTAGEG